jgi:hypothetical protein
MIRSMEGFTFASELDLNMGYYHIKLDAEPQSYVQLYSQWESTKQTLTHGYQEFQVPDVFQKTCLSLSKKWNILIPTLYLDDLLILTNRIFKDHLLKLE